MSKISINGVFFIVSKYPNILSNENESQQTLNINSGRKEQIYKIIELLGDIKHDVNLIAAE